MAKCLYTGREVYQARPWMERSVGRSQPLGDRADEHLEWDGLGEISIDTELAGIFLMTTTLVGGHHDHDRGVLTLNQLFEHEKAGSLWQHHVEHDHIWHVHAPLGDGLIAIGPFQFLLVTSSRAETARTALDHLELTVKR